MSKTKFIHNFFCSLSWDNTNIFLIFFPFFFFSFLTTEWGLKTIDWFQMSFFVYHHLLIQSMKIYFHFSILCICVCDIPPPLKQKVQTKFVSLTTVSISSSLRKDETRYILKLGWKSVSFSCIWSRQIKATENYRMYSYLIIYQTLL